MPRKFKLPYLLALVLVSLTGLACTTAKGFKGPGCPCEEVMVYPQGVVLLQVNGIDIPAWSERVAVRGGENELVLSLKYDYEPKAPTTYKLSFIAQAGAQYTIAKNGQAGTICAWQNLPGTEEPDFSRSYGCASE